MVRNKLSLMTTSEVSESRKAIPQWKLHDSTIIRELEFGNFAKAMAFVNRVAEAAEVMDHHPDILISYNKVKLDLSTHSAGGLTNLDFELAEKIDKLI